MNNIYINIKDVAEAKGLKSTRSLRLELNKNESKYISREVQVNGGTSYEILFSSLEPELQDKLRKNEKKTTALVPLNYQLPQFVSDQSKMTANFRLNIVLALIKFRRKYTTKKQADSDFLDLYNSGLYLPKAYKFIGSISLGTLHRWVRKYEKHESAECLQPNYKYSKQGEYNSILNDEMKQILLTLLLHPSRYNYGKAIKLTKEILKKRGYEQLPCDLSFKRYAENFRKNNYAEWVLRREGMKAYHDKVEPYIERDISKIEVGDVIVADGHVLNFQVINPFTGRPTRATLVGFLDWKSTALVGYEIMMTESTQCIASALRNAIINLGLIPKVVYQDNGKAFKSRFFQNVDFEEDLFNGVYANLNIHSVFAKPYNARAKVIERFFREFQEELEKGMPSYIGTSIEDKPAWLKRGEKLHAEWHKKLTDNHIPTVSEASKYINSWIEFHNNQPCPNDRTKTIKECLNSVQKQNIDIQRLDDLMMKTEGRTINKHGITFLNMHYRSEAILGIRDKVNIRYSLFDLSKVNVYSTKGTINFNTSSERIILCYPHLKVYDTETDTIKLQPYSQRLAGVIAAKDIEKGYHWSPSNTEIQGIVGVEKQLTSMINDPTSEVNTLNEAGIVTVFNSFGTGFRTWGNRSAAFPSSTLPTNFINVRRTADILHESVEYSMLQFIDYPIDNGLIDSICETVNQFIRTLIGRGALIDGKCTFNQDKNPTTELANGHLLFDIEFMPPTPAERITFESFIDIELLKSLGAS